MLSRPALAERATNQQNLQDTTIVNGILVREVGKGGNRFPGVGGGGGGGGGVPKRPDFHPVCRGKVMRKKNYCINPQTPSIHFMENKPQKLAPSRMISGGGERSVGHVKRWQ